MVEKVAASVEEKAARVVAVRVEVAHSRQLELEATAAAAMEVGLAGVTAGEEKVVVAMEEEVKVGARAVAVMAAVTAEEREAETVGVVMVGETVEATVVEEREEARVVAKVEARVAVVMAAAARVEARVEATAEGTAAAGREDLLGELVAEYVVVVVMVAGGAVDRVGEVGSMAATEEMVVVAMEEEVTVVGMAAVAMAAAMVDKAKSRRLCMSWSRHRSRSNA